jgi:hypothetical protein
LLQIGIECNENVSYLLKMMRNVINHKASTKEPNNIERNKLIGQLEGGIPEQMVDTLKES